MSGDNSKKQWYSRGGKTYNRGKPQWLNKNRLNNNGSSSSVGSNESENFEINYSPFKGWKFYFPEEDDSPTIKKIQNFQDFIENNSNLFDFEKIEDNKSFILDLLIIEKNDAFKNTWPNFTEDLNSNAEHTLSCLGLAMHQTILNRAKKKIQDKMETGDEDTEAELGIIYARIVNHQPILNLKNLKVNYYGKLVSVRGTVIRVTNVKLICRSMAFSCGSCGGFQVLRQPDGVYTLPTKCPTKGCRSQSRFTPLLSSSKTRTDNWQVLKLQELVGIDQCEGGRIPRTIECELTDDLVNSCVPGDDVTITGVIKVRNMEDNKAKQASVFLLYMDTISVTNNKNNSQSSSGASTIEFNLVDYYAIQKIHAEPHLFKLLVHSLCPQIFGHELVKAGLLLGLFGGAARGAGPRTDSHVLMVGDPGLGKSQMLQACSNVAPRGVFVCGNTSSSAGLTVTMTRGAGGDFNLEAGALVLADQGCCCIDEFDKMPTQHAALLEAMEQQSVSIAKAGVLCTLPARTTILAAANPAGGHYNRAKTVAENIRIGDALLSRFDLVFILRDKPNQLLDSLLSKHVLALHSGEKQKNPVLQTASALSQGSTDNSQSDTLQDRLRLTTQGEEIDTLPHQLFRKYIAYARKYVFPSLSEEAAEVLKQFYLELRKKHQTADSTPVTTRQVQSLSRLTLARAKAEMREIATKQDAIDVIELMKFCLVDTFSDENDTLDFTRSQFGSGISQRNKVKKFVAVLQRKAEIEARNLFTVAELKEIAKSGGFSNDFYNLLNSLNIHGYLLKKNSTTYKLLSVD